MHASCQELTDARRAGAELRTKIKQTASWTAALRRSSGLTFDHVAASPSRGGLSHCSPADDDEVVMSSSSDAVRRPAVLGGQMEDCDWNSGG